MCVHEAAATLNSTENKLIRLSVRLTRRREVKNVTYTNRREFLKTGFLPGVVLLYMLLCRVCRRNKIKEEANEKSALQSHCN